LQPWQIAGRNQPTRRSVGSSNPIADRSTHRDRRSPAAIQVDHIGDLHPPNGQSAPENPNRCGDDRDPGK
jgi:hypothetical protein